MNTTTTPTKGSRDVDGKFLAGGPSANPGGRPRGVRHRLANAFIEDLSAIYAERGRATIERAMDENPVSFLQALVKILPREVLAQLDIKAASTLELSVAQRVRIAEEWQLALAEEKQPALIEGTAEREPVKIKKAEPVKKRVSK